MPREDHAAFDAFYAHIDNVLLKTVPTTAAGCAVLARFVVAYPRDRGFSLDDEKDGQHVRILKLIARSPALRSQPVVDLPKPAISIADRVDVAAVTMDELRTIHEKMRHLSNVAYAMASQGCCRSADRSPFGNPHNAAGELMHWIGDALTIVESKAADELTRRQPTSLDDRETRLAAIAERVICNGDEAETATLIKELTAWAIERARR